MSVQLAPLSWLGITADSASYSKFNDTIWSTPSWPFDGGRISMFSTFTLQRPSTLPSQQPTSSLLSSSTFKNYSRLSILASSRDIFGHARASYDNSTFPNPGTWASPPLQTTTTNRSATSIPCQAHEQPPGFVATLGRPRQQHPTTIRCHPLRTEQGLPTRFPIHPSSHRCALA